jgi:hypothetical protein
MIDAVMHSVSRWAARKRPLQEVRRPDDLPKAEREPQMRDAGVEVLEEIRHERGQLPLVDVDEIIAQQRGRRRGGRLVAGASADGDLRPLA